MHEIELTKCCFKKDKRERSNRSSAVCMTSGNATFCQPYQKVSLEKATIENCTEKNIV